MKIRLRVKYQAIEKKHKNLSNLLYIIKKIASIIELKKIYIKKLDYIL